MSHRSSPRRGSAASAWLALGGALVAILVIALLGLWVWEQAGEIEALQAETLILHRERNEARAQLAELESKASALEQRLASLQAGDPDPQEERAQSDRQTGGGAEQPNDVRTDLELLGTRLDGLDALLAELLSRIQALEGATSAAPDPLPSEGKLTVVPQRQSHNLSCESSAAAMAAQFYGVPLTEAQVLAALPSHDNPHLGFRGNVDGPPGDIKDYGVYAGPILDILNASGLNAQRLEGGLEGIKTAIARGHPVIAWITYDCQYSTPVTRTIEGDVVRLVPYQHTVVVTGYDSNGVWANDPWDGQEDFYAAADFRRALAYFSDMAVEVALP